MNIQVQFVRKSSNAKIGAIPCTTSERSTCPDSCALKGKGGCYAESGYYTRLNWNKIDSRERGSDWGALCDSVARLPSGQVWRHNVAGDLPHTAQLIDNGKLGELVAANTGKQGFTYTHHNMTKAHNRKAVKRANAQGFAVNLSADNPKMADDLADLNVGPVVSVVPMDAVENFTTPKGRKIVICPASIRDDVTCATCKMCAKPTRQTIIGFPAHGATAKRINFDD